MKDSSIGVIMVPDALIIKPPKLKMTAEFTEDKLLRISVEQSDGRITDLSLRLGGKN